MHLHEVMEVGVTGKLDAEESHPKDHMVLSLSVIQTRRLVCCFLGRSRFPSLICETVDSCMKVDWVMLATDSDL